MRSNLTFDNHFFRFARCRIVIGILALALNSTDVSAHHASEKATSHFETAKVIIDTDIGGVDIDDAFAVALALNSPELQILGFSTTAGDTQGRALVIDRLLRESGFETLPVAVGVPTQSPTQSLPAGLMDDQRRYGDSDPHKRASHPDATDFVLKAIQKYPSQITLIAIGPLSNVGALIDKDITTFRKLKRIVVMGGQINPIQSSSGTFDPLKAEYNILLDVRSAQKLFRSGVQIDLMPIDSTYNLSFNEPMRHEVFSQITSETNALALLYLLWNQKTPVLYDAMPIAFVTRPDLCPVEPMHLIVDDTGVVHRTAGAPNVRVCLRSDPTTFFQYFMSRIISKPEGNSLVVRETH